MRLHKTALCSASLLFIWSPFVRAEPIRPDELTNQVITVPFSTASADDYLLDLARAAHINVVADSTDFSAAPVKSYPSTPSAIAGQQGANKNRWRPSLINLMGDFAAQQKLSTLRTDTRTFLFWREPEPYSLFASQLALTQAAESSRLADIVAVARGDGVPETELPKDALPDDELKGGLRVYLQNAFNWTPSVANRNDKVDIRVRWNEMPPVLRVLILRDLRERFVNIQNYQFLRDDFWKSVDVRLRADTPGNGATLNVEFSVPIINGASLSTVPFTRLDGIVTPIEGREVPLAVTAEEPYSLPPLDVRPAKDAAATFIEAYTGLSDEAALPEGTSASLRTPVSLHVQKLSLRDLLAQLQQQSGVKLELEITSPSTKLITAHVEKMPLSQVMGVLSRMYGLQWYQRGAAYIMGGEDPGESRSLVLRIGDPQRYRFRYMFYNRTERETEKKAVGNAIVENVGMTALHSPQGVAVTDLPQPLQKQLRRALEQPVAEANAIALYNANRMIAEQLVKDGFILHFGVSAGKTYRTPFTTFNAAEPLKFLRFRVQSEDGKVMLPVFDSFYYSVAEPGEQDERPAGRRR